jgi:hypothetical protein
VTLPRRVFVEPAEIPRLCAGVLRGERAALRRVLGARRAGRIGALAALASLLLAAPWSAAPALAALHGALALGVGWVTRGTAALLAREVLRLSTWPVAPLLLLAALARPFAPRSALAALLAILCANALLWRAVRHGLDERSGFA